jgi:hypothetical protein
VNFPTLVTLKQIGMVDKPSMIDQHTLSLICPATIAAFIPAETMTYFFVSPELATGQKWPIAVETFEAIWVIVPLYMIS